MNTQEFLILPPEEVGKLLASDDLNIQNEEIIYSALIMWINHDIANRKKYLAKLMSHIRLPLMSPTVSSLFYYLQYLSHIIMSPTVSSLFYYLQYSYNDG